MWPKWLVAISNDERSTLPMAQPEIDADPTIVNLKQRVSEPKTAHDMFGHLIGLQFAISELLSELAVDTIQQHPRVVLMALRGLEARAAKVVAIAKGEIEIDK